MCRVVLLQIQIKNNEAKKLSEHWGLGDEVASFLVDIEIFLPSKILRKLQSCVYDVAQYLW